MSMSSGPERAAEEPWRPTKRQVVAGIIAVLVLLAILQNTRSSEFNFLLFDFEAPVWLLFTAIFGGGFATGFLIARRRARRAARRS
jgi:uncharacterized integral membrane protein